MSDADRHVRIPYEPALDGLRALAVIAVVLFHSDLNYGGQQWFGAGFLGVDAFFVLSGFLITALLLVERDATGRIGLATFWSRRARRLLPALFAMVAFVVGYAALQADPAELPQIRTHGLASVAYLANWQFIREGTSYFTQYATPSPFQHLWSLAIEEQWYVLWPIVVLGVLHWRRGSARAVMWVSIAGALASAALMAALHQPGDPSRVYFGTDTRAQSLLVGSAFSAALISGVSVPDWVARRVLPPLGSLLALGLGYLWVTGSWQADWYYRGGFLALATATGIVVVAAVQPEATLLRRVLSLRPLTAVGVISYGIYLWHWPLRFVIDRRVDALEDWSFEAITALRLAATLAVSIVSYVALERPIRRGTWSRRIRFAPALIPVSAAALVTLLVMTTAPPERPTLTTTTAADPEVPLEPVPQLPTRDDLEQGIDPSTRPMPAGAATTDATKVLVLGDSVAYTMANGFTEDVQEDVGLMVWNQTVLFCELAEGPRLENGLQVDPSDTCADRDRRWSKSVRQFEPDIVLLHIGAWEIFDRKVDGEWLRFGEGEFNDYFTAMLDDTIDVLSEGDVTVVLVTAPHFERSDAVSAQVWTQNETWRTTHLNELFTEVADRRADTVVLPLADWLCPDDACLQVLPTGEQVRYDGVHFTDEGAVTAAQWLAPQLRAVALSRQPPDPVPPSTAATTVAPAPERDPSSS